MAKLNSGTQVYGNLIVSTFVTVTGNVIGGNITTAGLISATGNITGGNVLFGSGIVSGTGNVIGGNVLFGSGIVSGTGNVTGNIGTFTTHNGTTVSVTGSITGGAIQGTSIVGTSVTATSATGRSSFGTDGGGSLTIGFQANNATATTPYIDFNSSAIFVDYDVRVQASGNTGTVAGGTLTVTAAALVASSAFSAIGTITGGNITTAGNVNTANIYGSAGTTITTGGNANINLYPGGTGNIVLPSGNTTYINNLPLTPLSNNDAASKYYVDQFASTALSYHSPVVAATVVTLATATGGTTSYTQPNGAANGIGAYISTTGTFNLIDTANVQTLNTRILVKNESNSAWNGVYVWTNTTAITRSSDTDTYGTVPNSLSINDYFFVTDGNVNAGSAWVVNSPTGTITFGTSAITFAEFSSSQTYTSGNGISFSGTIINARVDDVTTAFDGGGNISVKASATLTTPNIGAATGTSLSTTGNLTGGNILTSGLISVTGNVIGGNILTSGLISVTGNITGGNVIITSSTASTSKTTGALTVAGGVGISNDLTVGNSITVDGGAYGNVVTTQFASIFASGSGPNPRSIMQVRGADGVAGMGIQGISGGNGQIYANTGIIFTTGSTLRDKDYPTGGTTRVTIDSTGLAVTGLISATGNIIGNNFSATGNLTLNSNAIIFGDFSNATFTSRTVFSSSAANSNPGIYAVPNGTGNAASWQALNSNVATNASKILIATNGTTDVQLVSGINGTGTYLPLSFWNNGVSQMQLTTTGNLNMVNGGSFSTTGNINGNVGTFTTHNGTTFSASGNITGGNLLLSGAITDSAQLDIQTSAGNANIVLTPNGTGNVNTGANLSVTGNVQSGNVRTVGLISATGNVTAANIIATGNVFFNQAIVSISANTTAALYTYYVLTANLTLTLPASPSVGNWVNFTNRSGVTTCVLARNGSNIMGLAQDMNLNTLNARATMGYTGATQGWVIINE